MGPELPRQWQCPFQLFHESGARWRTEGAWAQVGDGGQGPLELGRTPGPQLPIVQPEAVGGDPVWAPQNRQESHPSPPGLGPGLGCRGPADP